MRIRICIPSYRRTYVKTFRYICDAACYVDGKEFEEYKKANPGREIVCCPDGVQGNVARVRNYILDMEFGNGADVVFMCDDDLDYIGYFEGNQRKRLNGSMIMPFLEKYSELCRGFGAYYWGINVNPDKQCYREYTPFSTTSFIGGPFQCFLKGNECRYDERLPLKEDYDMTLQNLNRYRCVLRVNKYHYVCKQSENKGGCACYRNVEREKQQMVALQQKWGGEIVRFDTGVSRSHVSKKNRKVLDYNPIIHPPIKGV